MTSDREKAVKWKAVVSQFIEEKSIRSANSVRLGPSHLDDVTCAGGKLGQKKRTAGTSETEEDLESKEEMCEDVHLKSGGAFLSGGRTEET